jgi:acyl-CoA synthetase (AMP-forming)/AMP-acid ligase II
LLVNVAELLAIPAAAFPDQRILHTDGIDWSYADLATGARHMAAALMQLGVTSGDRVAFMETNTPPVVELIFATALCGATLVPLNYRARADELEPMLRLTRPRLLVVGDRYGAIARAGLQQADVGDCRVLPFSSVADADPGLVQLAARADPLAEDDAVDDQGPAVLLFTSGTSARAKAVILGHDDLTTYVTSTAELATGEDVGRTAVAAPLYHIAGLTVVLTAVFTGRTIVLLRQFEAADWLATVARERVTHAFLVPTMLKRILDDPSFASSDLSSLRLVSYGAAPMPVRVIRRAIDAFPAAVGFLNAFGQTESSATVTALRPEDHRLQGTPAEIELRVRRLSSVGRPLPDVELRIVDDAGEALPSQAVGEIAIRSDRTMRGYYGDDDATSATLRDGWLFTRDLGWVDEGGYLFLAGRKSDMIIRGGENIAPEEIEVVLAAHPAVDEVAVFGVPDLDWGEVIAAAVVPRPDQPVTAAELTEFCRARLASFKTPAHVVLVDELPRNSLGKVLRRELRERLTPAPGNQTG